MASTGSLVKREGTEFLSPIDWPGIQEVFMELWLPHLGTFASYR